MVAAALIVGCSVAWICVAREARELWRDLW